MELEYFVSPKNWEKEFDKLQNLMENWFTKKLGLSPNNLHTRGKSVKMVGLITVKKQ